MALYWTDKRGKKWPVCSCQQKWLTAYQDEMLRRGIIRESLDLYQTIGGSAASGGTHTRGGATDFAQTSTAAVRLARDMGADASWYRPKNWDGRGGMPHHHSVLRGCPHMVPVAGYQYSSTRFGVDHGHNGLANGAKDTGPLPLSKRTWEEGIAWAKAQAAAAAKPASETPPVTDSCTFNYLGMNIYASQYTGNAFSAKRKAALKATFAGTTGANASWNALSEVNRDLDHDTVVSLLGAQFNHSDTFTRAAGNNHHYPDANKWTRTGVKVVLLLNQAKSQERRVTLVVAKHKATGITGSFWATHLSSAAAYRNMGYSDSKASKQTALDQVAEAKALAVILAGTPLPGWDITRSVGYIDSNREDGIAPWLDGKGTTDIYDLVKVGNSEYGSLHALGKAPDKTAKHIDRVRVGSNVKVVTARQIIGHYDATDHLGLACQLTIVGTK